MEQTKNLNLNRWAPEDFVRLTQINQNFDKLDEEVGALKMEHLALGTYTGDGSDSRVIALPFAPKLAILMGTVNSSLALTLITPKGSRYITSDSIGQAGTYTPSLDNDRLLLKHHSWSNDKGETMVYIIFQ